MPASPVMTMANRLHGLGLARPEAFRRARELARGEAAVRVAGVTFGNRQEILARYRETGVREAFLVREPDNPADPNAIAVVFGMHRVGYVPRNLAHALAPVADRGFRIRVRRAEVVGGGGLSYGARITLEIA